MNTQRSLLPWLLLVLALVAGGWFWWDTGTTELVVDGEATVKAAPDEYVFRPSYEARDADKSKARETVTKTGNEVVATLKALGVTDAQLATEVSVRDDYDAFPTPDRPGGQRGTVATYTITVTLEAFELAQKVQDALVTTPVVGQVTPISGFKDATRNTLEREARKLALEDAKAQAEDTASTLDVKLRGIASIGQPSWGGPVMPFGVAEDKAVSSLAVPEFSSPDLLVGEQEVSYSIEVVYRVR